MTEQEIVTIVYKQREYFLSGATEPIKCREEALKRLRTAVISQEDKLSQALKADLGKGGVESYMCEIGLVLSEIGYMLKHVGKLAKPKKVKTPMSQFSAKSYVLPSPLGVALILSPWNYPLLLTLSPLIDALAAGNTAVVKPSAYSVNTSHAVKELIESCFEPQYVAVITGGRAENTHLLRQKFDHIFFTGSTAVGHEVMRAASEHLTPVTLELGGKSPCIVDKTADIPLAARRIVFGKYLNCGQTCVAPDYIMCHESVKDIFVAEVVKQIALQFGNEPLSNPNYGKIINAKHFDRLVSLIDPDKVVVGGQSNADQCRIAPTVMDNVTELDAVMREEIFGPIMPILTYSDGDDLINSLKVKPHPLALYVFSTDNDFVDKTLRHINFGGGCVNDTIIHLATHQMAFGGVGDSGMGGYHGKRGFETFTHYKSIVHKRNWIDLGMRYQPYTKSGEKLIRKFLK